MRTEEQKANLRKLVEALRSGQYKQGAGRLHPTDDTYCCLGVMCDISGVEAWVKNTTFGWCFSGAHTAYPPKSVSSLFGLSTFQMDALVQRNDTGKTFEEIARYIEEELIGSD